jgi:hypothetical protein
MGDAIARYDAAEVALADQEPAFLEMHRHAVPLGTFNEMDMAAELAILDPVAQPDDRLEQPRFGCKRIIVIASPFQGLGFPGRGHVEPIDCPQHAQMGQHAEHAMARQQDTVGADGTPAAPLAAKIRDFSPVGRRRRQS